MQPAFGRRAENLWGSAIGKRTPPTNQTVEVSTRPQRTQRTPLPPPVSLTPALPSKKATSHAPLLYEASGDDDHIPPLVGTLDTVGPQNAAVSMVGAVLRVSSTIDWSSMMLGTLQGETHCDSAVVQPNVPLISVRDQMSPVTLSVTVAPAPVVTV
jgi:hypothetical protein